MSKKSSFRRPFEKQHGKCGVGLLKSASQHLYHIHWSLARKLSLKKSLLSTCKVSGCLLTHCLSMTSFLFLIERIERYQFRWNYLRNKKLFLIALLHFLNLAEILNVWKKKMTLLAFVFPKLQTPKTSLNKCQKGLLSEDRSTRKTENVLKHCWNLHHSSFMKFIDHCQINWAGKSLCYWHAKLCDCLLTNCLPRRSILFLIKTLSGHQFRCNYLRNKKTFRKFFLVF